LGYHGGEPRCGERRRLWDRVENVRVSTLLEHHDVHGGGQCLKVLMPEQIEPDLAKSNFLDSVVSMLAATIESPLRMKTIVLRDLVKL